MKPPSKKHPNPQFSLSLASPRGVPAPPTHPPPCPLSPQSFPIFSGPWTRAGHSCWFFFAVFLLVVRSYPFWAVLGGGRVNFHPSAESGSVTAHMADEQVLIVPKTPLGHYFWSGEIRPRRGISSGSRAGASVRPVARRLRGGSVPSFTLTLVSGLPIFIVGFLAWGIPFLTLTAAEQAPGTCSFQVALFNVLRLHTPTFTRGSFLPP